MTRVLFLQLLSSNFDDQLSSNFHRFVISCICWDTPTEKTSLRPLPIVSTAFKGLFFSVNSSLRHRRHCCNSPFTHRKINYWRVLFSVGTLPNCGTWPNCGVYLYSPWFCRKFPKTNQTLHNLMNKFENLSDYGNFVLVMFNVILNISFRDRVIVVVLAQNCWIETAINTGFQWFLRIWCLKIVCIEEPLNEISWFEILYQGILFFCFFSVV